MDNSDRNCLVLYPHLTRADFEAAATTIGLDRYTTTAGDARRAYEQVWTTANSASAVHYLEDPLVGLTWISIRGVDVSSLTTAMALRIELIDREEALERAEGAVSHNVKLEALARVAVTFHQFDPRAFLVFAAFATEPGDALLREAAANLMAYRAWPEFVPVLGQMVADDADNNVRRRAAEVLKHLDNA